MNMRLLFSSLLVLGAGLAMAQKASFDVASIKPSDPQPMGVVMMRMGSDRGMIDYKHVNLRALVQRAFNVKDYQVAGPNWMGSEFFDVQAKLPPDTPDEKRAEMLQTLLEERFGLKFHKETKEVPIYSLVVGKNGPKLKQVEPPPNMNADGTLKQAAAGGGFAKAGPDGPPKMGRGPGPGGMMIGLEGGGKAHLQAKAAKMSMLVDLLSRQVDRPVIDNTGLTGFYDINLDFKPDMAAMMKGMPGPMMGGRGPEGGPGGPAPDSVEAPSIFTAVQDQLGLKLESKKGPVETIVVDHIAKSPIEN